MRASRYSWLVVSLVIAPTAGAAQESDASNTRAIEVVEAAIEAMGGAALDNIKTLSYDVVGHRYWLGQGARPDLPARMPVRGHVRINFESGSVRLGTPTHQYDEIYFCFHRLLTPEAALSYECLTRIEFPIPEQARERARAQMLARYPEPREQLDGALRQSSDLAYEGLTDGPDGAEHVVVRKSPRGSLTFYFDSQTSLLSRIEGEPMELLLGERTVELGYSDYRTISGITLPTRLTSSQPRRATIGSVITDDLRLSNIQIDAPIPDSIFVVPTDLHEAASAETSVEEIAGGVFLLQNITRNYNQLFVEFDDFVLVIDAPNDGELSRVAIEQIRTVIPEKPIRYIVATHSHYDHIGGIGAYIAEGATLVTTPGNRSFLEDVATRWLDAQPDNEARVRSVTVVGDMTMASGGQLVELYDIGPNPHADELIIAYFPEHRLLYVTDVFSADWGQVRPAIAETRAFAERLQELGLEVDIVVPSHGMPVTIQEFRQSFRPVKREQ